VFATRKLHTLTRSKKPGGIWRQCNNKAINFTTIIALLITESITYLLIFRWKKRHARWPGSQRKQLRPVVLAVRSRQ